MDSQTEWQTNRQTDKRKDRQTNKHTGRQTDKQKDRQTDKRTVKLRDRQTDWLIDKQTDGRTDRQTDWQTYRQTDRQTNRQKNRDRQTDRQTGNQTDRQRDKKETKSVKQKAENGTDNHKVKTWHRKTNRGIDTRQGKPYLHSLEKKIHTYFIRFCCCYCIIYVLQKYRDENAAIRIQVAKSYYHRLYLSRSQITNNETFMSFIIRDN